MARGHPVDELGRILPDPAWPTERAAPGELDLIRRFCNTTVVENGADRLATAAATRRWLEAEGFDVGRVTTTHVEALREFRSVVRSHAADHNSQIDDAARPTDLAGHVSTINFAARSGDDGLDLGVVGRDPFEVVAGRVTLLIVEAQRRRRWQRFKACRNCRWVFYDSSKNRSGTWCSMSACGGRAKVGAYRARLRADDPN